MINSISNYDLIKKALDATSARSKIIANNIANINTPGYKRSYVSFEDKLNESLSNDFLQLKVNDEKHISNKVFDVNYEIKKDTASSMRADGNNVDIDNEMVNLAANNLMYNFLVTRASGSIADRLYIIDNTK